MNWEQLRAILWLRWRLSRNQFIRGGTLNAVVSLLLTILVALGGCGTAVGGIIGGWAAGSKASPQILLTIMDAVVFAFLVFWGTGLMVEIQRSESIDLPKLLHLPITLRQVFVFNYLVSHLSPVMVLFLPGLMGLCLGLALGGGAMLALTIPAALGFVFMLTAWTYCLRGWLAALMTNKRRRRSIIVWVSLVFVLFSQLPNLFVNSSFFSKAISHHGQPQDKESGSRAIPQIVIQAHVAIPLGWLGYSAMALKERNPWPAVGASVAGVLLGALGILRAYRMTLRFYQGCESGGRAAAPPPATARQVAAPGRLLLERRLPGLPDEVSALALATFRSLLRSPELKMIFIMPAVLGMLAASTRLRTSASFSPGKWNVLFATGAVALAAFSIAPTMGNAFGLDRDGFRALVLLPTRRHYVLLAKNLAFFPFLAAVGLFMLGLATVLARIPFTGLLMGLFQIPTAFLLFSLLSNFSSILAPFRMTPGTLKAKKPKAIVFLAVFVNFFALALVSPLLVAPPGCEVLAAYLEWPRWFPAGALAAAAILPLVAWGYWLALPFQGRLLQRREQTILLEVTEETE